MGVITFRLEGKEAGGVRAFLRLTEAQRKAELGALKVGKAGRKTSQDMKAVGKSSRDAFDLGPMKAFIGGLVGAGSVTAALMKVSERYQVWRRNIQEIAAEARKASGEILSFAALQAGGEKAGAVRKAAAMGLRYGITERGVAFDTVQALQSARGGDLAAGLAGARSVFQAYQVGIPLEKGRELEVLGAAQGQAPGAALRRAYVAGQASARDPAALATAAPGMTFWQDKDLGFAAAGVIAGAVREGELQTYVKAAGIGLSDVSTLETKFKDLGVLGTPRVEKLRALAGAGLDTPEKLKAAGLSEIRQQQAVSILVQNLENLDRITAEIQQKARPGIFAAHRTAVEAELPITKTTRQIDMAETMLAHEAAFGKPAGPAAKEILLEKMAAVALRRMGKEQTLWFDLIEDGRASKLDVLRYVAIGDQAAKGRRAPEGRLKEFEAQMRQITQEMTDQSPESVLQGEVPRAWMPPPGTPEEMRQAYEQHEHDRARQQEAKWMGQPAPVIHNHGDNFFLGERGDLTRPGADAPEQGVMN